MKRIEITYPFDPANYDLKPVSLAIGFFDGLHLGHQAVIQQAIQTAKEQHVPSAVMTFSPHPREVLGHTTFAGYLTPLPEKIRQLEQLGVDYMYVVHFDEQFAKVTKEQFISKMLVPMQVVAVTTGFNFTFGHRGLGTASDLLRLSKGLFAVTIVEPVIVEQSAVSSTRIRNALSVGEIGLATKLLGRAYRLQGEVVHGDKRGRQIGFLTANIAAGRYYVPAKGVYVVRANVRGETMYGVMNVGVRPTFDSSQSQPKLEVHLLDQPTELDLYGETIAVEALHYLRNETKFSSVDALVAQIRKDEAQARAWLATSTANI
jgi:riboflavin kinase/FMN adenylyltransferase